MSCRAELKNIPAWMAGCVSRSLDRNRKAFNPVVEISIYIHEKHRGRGVGRRRKCGQLRNAGVKFWKQ